MSAHGGALRTGHGCCEYSHLRCAAVRPCRPPPRPAAAAAVPAHLQFASYVRTARRARACARGGLAAHAMEYREHSHATLSRLRLSAHARTVSTHSHWAVELPAHAAVRRAHVGYSEYSRYCEYLHEIPEYRKSTQSALPAETPECTRHGLPPPSSDASEAGAGPHVARYPDRYPARHGARKGTRSTRVRWRRTRSGVGGRAGAVSGRRRARCTKAQRRRECGRIGRVRIGVP